MPCASHRSTPLTPPHPSDSTNDRTAHTQGRAAEEAGREQAEQGAGHHQARRRQLRRWVPSCVFPASLPPSRAGCCRVFWCVWVKVCLLLSVTFLLGSGVSSPSIHLTPPSLHNTTPPPIPTPLGTARSSDCTLILTEGDSAKTLAISGLSVVGRDYYGVFPLKVSTSREARQITYYEAGRQARAVVCSCGWVGGWVGFD